MNYFFSKKQQSVAPMGKSSSQTEHQSNAQDNAQKILRSCQSNEDLNKTNRHQKRQMPMSVKGHNNRKKQHDNRRKNYQQIMIDEAFICYLQSEASYLPDGDWINKNKKLSPSYRSAAIAYMSTLHKNYELEFRTLLLSFNVFDRFMSKACQSVNSISQLWEVVYASMDIAMKIQQIYPPQLDQILQNQWEGDIQKIGSIQLTISEILDYRFDKVSPMSYFGGLSCTANMSQEETYLTQFLMELHCHSRYLFGRYAFSLVAITIDYMLHLWRSRDQNYRGGWQNRIPKHSLESIKSLANELFSLGRRAKVQFAVLYNSYGEPEREKVTLKDYFETRV